MHTYVIQGGNLTEHHAANISRQLSGNLEINPYYCLIKTDFKASQQLLNEIRRSNEIDINVLPDTFQPEHIKLLITDMDSTFINIECVDEIADHIGIKPQVAEITEATMRGELDFSASLTQRVALLQGMETSALDHVYHQRLTLNPGGERMLTGLKSLDIKIALVSGGFTFFTKRLQQRYDLDYTLANELDIENGQLTGRIVGDIVGAEAKADFLNELCNELDILPSQTVAVGDGANDLLMMNQAGLSIAYHAKPKVQEQAATVINYCGLEGILGLLQIDRSNTKS